MALDEQITFFFAVPDPEQEGEVRSTLHQLRREAQDCLIGKVVAEELVIDEARKDPHRLFATVMVLMAGIDLLSKLYAGSDKKGEVKRRFLDFSRRYVVNGSGDVDERAEALYQGLRNPLIHSFTLHSEEYQMRLVVFQGQGHPVWLRKSDSKQVIVSIAGVFDAFVRAVRAYEEDLRRDVDLRARFSAMYAKYGTVAYFVRPA